MSHPFRITSRQKPLGDVGAGENGGNGGYFGVDNRGGEKYLATSIDFLTSNVFGRFDCWFCQNFMVNLLTFHVGFDFLVMSHVASEELGRW